MTSAELSRRRSEKLKGAQKGKSNTALEDQPSISIPRIRATDHRLIPYVSYHTSRSMTQYSVLVLSFTNKIITSFINIK